ncbi:IS1595 family transposase [Paenibacillus apiarius]|uniref:IS1595 family transposase n=1 Tax=Paenibacillus apiarius TaxID=46240 RepID=UPI003B3B57B2
MPKKLAFYVTLFYWRHKILTALAQINAEELNGIVEVDETYFLESQKGAIPTHRSSRKRGGSAKKRGLSTEQICVLIARDREKNTFYKVIGRGKPTKDSLELHLGNRLGTDIVFVPMLLEVINYLQRIIIFNSMCSKLEKNVSKESTISKISIAITLA